MRPLLSKVFSVTAVLMAVFSWSLNAQEKIAFPRTLSVEDKQKIVAMFKGGGQAVDLKYYRLVLNGGKEKYGSLKLTSSTIAETKKALVPDKGGVLINFTNARTIIYLRDGSTIYVLARAGTTRQDPLVSLLGQEGASGLRDLLSKYYIHEVND